jgi:chemotaxis protein MotB
MGEPTMWRRVAIALVACGSGLCTGTVLAQQSGPKTRVALIIGNSSYNGGAANPKGLARLANPARDARAIAGLLKQHGFDVSEGYDLDRDRFARLLAQFSRQTSTAHTALVFYAGHGMEVIEKDDLVNVLAPINAEIECETRDHFNTIKLDDIMRAIRGVPNQMVILDACRNNPFPQCPAKRGNAARSFGFRAVDLTARRGEAILLAYSTAQKAFADDGRPGENSPFAKELLAVLRENPRTQFLPLMNKLVVDVGTATKFQQVPSVTIEGGVISTCLAGEGCEETTSEVSALQQKLRAVEAADKENKSRIAELQLKLKNLAAQESNSSSQTKALAKNVAPSEEAAVRTELLNQQLLALRRQIAALVEALDAAEAKDKENQARITDLGSRLNIVLARQVQELQRYRSDLFGRLRESLRDRKDIRVVGDRFVFQSDVLFPSGQATLTPQGITAVDQLATAIVELERTIPKEIAWSLQVEGHTDSRAIASAQFPSNWELSNARATSVVKHLIIRGVPPQRLVAAGHGEFQPLEEGASEDALRRNRRIEVRLLER